MQKFVDMERSKLGSEADSVMRAAIRSMRTTSYKSSFHVSQDGMQLSFPRTDFTMDSRSSITEPGIEWRG